MRSFARVPLAAASLIVGLAIAACGSGAPASPAAAPTTGPPAGSLCPDLHRDGKQVHFSDSGGASLAGIEVGTGSTAIVLAHQSNGDSCQWLPYGNQLVTDGYRVLVFDFAGHGVSDPAPTGTTLDADVVAAAAYLAGQGATHIVLIGASMGGNAALVAATEIQPPVAGVISLSAPATYQGLDATPAVANLSVPVLYIAGNFDTSYANDAQALYAATPAVDDRKLLVVNSSYHGVKLVDPLDEPESTQVRTAIAAFLASHAPISG